MSIKKNNNNALLGQSEAQIFFPEGLPFTFQGTTYSVLPMPDAKLMRVGEELATIGETAFQLAEKYNAGMTVGDIADFLPQLVKALLPKASVLISISLDIPLELAQQMPMASKLEALGLILKAENMPAILKNWNVLLDAFRQENGA